MNGYKNYKSKTYLCKWLSWVSIGPSPIAPLSSPIALLVSFVSPISTGTRELYRLMPTTILADAFLLADEQLMYQLMPTTVSADAFLSADQLLMYWVMLMYWLHIHLTHSSQKQIYRLQSNTSTTTHTSYHSHTQQTRGEEGERELWREKLQMRSLEWSFGEYTPLFIDHQIEAYTQVFLSSLDNLSFIHFTFHPYSSNSNDNELLFI